MTLPARVSYALGLLAALTTGPVADAGDLLRGGSPAGTRGVSPATTSSAQAAAQARANAQDALARTTQAVNAVQALQNAARNAASAGANNLGRANGLQLPDVPNGLTTGGLVLAPGGVYQGANAPQQTTSNGQTIVDIQQTAQQAIITWQTFNIGKKTLLNFDQNFGGSQTSQWIAFNLVNDPSGVPSQILGSIQASGQVFVVNRNGIIFGGASQVNTHALFASSLPINTSLITAGLLVNPSAQFLFSSSSFASTTAFTPPATHSGDVIVEAGASISAPTSAAHVGGRVVLVGPNVTNSGTITTPDGQTILAAGQQVGFQAHPSADPTLRGLDAYIGADDTSSGTATNNGLIEAPRGDSMITGSKVNQNGVIDSSTSVTLNGRVDLLAEFGANPVQNASNPNLFHLAPQSTGTVTFGQGSVTQILPEWSSTETNVGTQLPLPSQVIVQGQTIHMGANAILLAPGAMAPAAAAKDLLGNSLSSGVTFNAGSWVSTNATSDPLFLNVNGQISLDPGAMINVAGSTDVMVPVSQNILSVTLRGTELANSPTQRQGLFRGTAINVDIRNTGSYNGQYWVGTPLANVAGFVGLIEKGVGQLSVDGGTVALSAGGSVIVQHGATINVSGGYLQYTGGLIQTTHVLSGDHVLDISQATPDRNYGGIYTGQFTASHVKWGVTDQFTSPLALTGAHYENSYDQGGNGGTLTVTAPTMALDGTFLGNTVTGSHQLRTTSTTFASTSSDAFTTSTSSAPPALGTLNLAFQAVDQSVLAAGTVLTDFPSTTPPNIVFQNGVTLPPASATNVDSQYNLLLGERGTTVVLSPELLAQNGFGHLNINNRDGTITVPAGVALKAPAGGSIAFTGVNIDIEGNVSAPAGGLTFNVNDFSALGVFNAKLPGAVTPSPDLTRGNFTLGASATLSAAGLIVDDRHIAPNPLTLPLTVDGGSITINSYHTDLLPGSVIDVSGGVAISPTGKKTYGNGGSITIASGRDIALGAVLGGTLELGSELKGYSAGGGSSSVGTFSGGGNGGSLSIQTTLIQIGGVPSAPNALFLTPQFFDQGGFGSFTLTALGEIGPSGNYLTAINIAPGTVIAPVVQAHVAVTTASGVTWQPVDEPLGYRTPVNLTFKASLIADPNLVALANQTVAITRGDFVLGAGAEIRTDPAGTVTINTQTAAILGSIVAPGGSISITTNPISATTGGNNLSNPAGQLLVPLDATIPSLNLGPHSFLSTAGTVVLLPNQRGYQVGSVLAGGSISLSGNIVAEAGSVLDVSGTSGILDLAPAASGQSTSLLGALSGQVVMPQTRMSAPTFRGLLIPSLPNGANSDLSSGSFSGTSVTPTMVESNGGSITITAAAELFTDAALVGKAGGPAAVGGTLTITATTISVKQGGSTIPVSSFYKPGLTALLNLAPAQATNGQTAIGQPVLAADGTPLVGSFFTANSFNTGGFDNLVLGGVVSFTGPVSITSRNSITIATGGSLTADSTVNLKAPYVDLGAAFVLPGNANPLTTLPTFGSGQLNVTAQFIDIGNLALLNIGQATFTAIDGDIRGDGTLAVQGNIVMRAGQIYPATGVNFTIAASDYTVGGITMPGTVTILPGGIRQLPLSAAGTLDITGSIINQGGTLRAPLGTINLGTATTTQVNLLPGSITSVSAIDPISGQGLLIPYGINVNGTSWIDPIGTDITAGLVPQKSVNILGTNVNTQAGSTIDVRGGGDLLAYQWVSGAGGTNDVLSWNYEGAWSSTANYQATQVVSYKGSYYYATVTNPAGPPAIGPSWNKVTPSFAVIPGYQASAAPYAPYNNTSLFGLNAPSAISDTLGADQGYVNNLLTVGSSIYLGATPGLKAGVYTLLPARYALLPGAFLVTPQSTSSVGTFSLTDNSSITAGYRLNSQDQSTANPQLYTTVAVASAQVIAQRALYTDYTANNYLRTESQILGIPVARMPSDAGSLVLSGSATLAVNGNVEGQGADGGGRGAVIDLSTTEKILVGGPGGSAPAGTAYLNATLLDSYGAESILIGGTRQTGATGTTITVNTSSIEVNNAGAPLVGPEILLVSKGNLTLDPGAEIDQRGSIPQGSLSTTPNLLIGNSSTAGSGDGVLFGVSDQPINVIRTSIDNAAGPNVVIGAGATVTGQYLTVDSTAGGTIDPTASLLARNIGLKAGRISLVFPNPPAAPVVAPGGIVLQGSVLANVLASPSVSLSGYQSIDIYSSGTNGSLTAGNLGLHTGDLRGFTNSGADVVTINAASLTLDNANNVPGQASSGPAAGAPIQGSLVVNATTITIGANTLNIDQFANVNLSASSGVILQNTGGLTTQKNLTLTTPIIVGTAQATQTITAQGGALSILAPAGGGTGADLAAAAGLGATLNLTGNHVTENSRIYLPSGQINVTDTASTAAAGGISIGGTLDVSGVGVRYYDTIAYTPGGNVTLSSANGSVTLAPGSIVSVAANPDGGNAGGLSVSAPKGDFTLDGSLSGQGGAGGTNGTFIADFSPNFNGSTPTLSLSTFDGILNAGGFTQSRTFRMRTGNVSVDGAADALNYSISADAGSIEVTSTGNINASGVTGGSISLVANGSVTLDAGSMLSVAGQLFSDAGKGGSVTLEAGSEVNGVPNLLGAVNIASGSTIDLSVAALASTIASLTPAEISAVLTSPSGVTGLTPAQIAALTPTQIAGLIYGDFTGTLHIRSPQNATGTGFAVKPILNGTIIDPSSIVLEGYQIYNLTGTGGAITNTGTNVAPSGANGVVLFSSAGQNVEGSVKANGTTFVNGTAGLYATLLASNPDVVANNANGTQLAAALSITPGAELINTAGPSPLTFTLGTSGSSGLVAPSTGVTFYFPTGTPGNDKIQSTVAGTITSPSGTVTKLLTGAANAVAIQAGSTVTLSGAGTLSFSAGGTGGAITVYDVTPAVAVTTSGAGVVTTAATGNLTLGTTSLTVASDWDLSSFRFGSKNVPGVLTFRAGGNLVFFSSLSDGFSGAAATAAGQALYTAPLMAYNPLLPANAQSYTYNLTAGADFTGVSPQAVLPLAQLQGAGIGSLLLGKVVGANGTASGTVSSGELGVTGGSAALTSKAAIPYAQMIRTGSGDINISAGNSVDLMNNLASIYTAGTQVANASVLPDGTLDLPTLFTTTSTITSASTSNLGAAQEPFRSATYQKNPQYSLGGGNISINAQGTIQHLNLVSGALVADSSKEMPDNWLGRRDIVSGGQFATSPNGDLGSTTWWVDFSNFFEGVGALGGGNITLNAGGDIVNVDALIPTNARAAGFTDATRTTKVAPGAGHLWELGGGDLVVKAGGNINAGVYYVEAGTGTLTAGKSIITNATRDISIQNIGVSNATPFVPNTTSNQWLPTTLFLGGNARNGAGGFTIFANQDVTLGPVANPFLLPESIDNLSVYRTYFSTYAPTDYVNVSSLTGKVTLAENLTTAATFTAPTPFLQAWFQNILSAVSGGNAAFNASNVSFFQPWLRLDETFRLQGLDSTNFGTTFAVLPPTLDVTAFSSDINLQGNLTLMPSPTGTIQLLAKGQINGLQSTGALFGASTINLSDANPANVYGVTTPLALVLPAGTVSSVTANAFLRSTPNFGGFNTLFAESGQTSGPGFVNGLDYGSPLTQEALHDATVLHAADPNPARLYTLSGNISGLTLISSKPTEVLAGQDITDVGLFIQNVSDQSISVVAAGRDIIPYAPTTLLPLGDPADPSGDIQISGPGTLEVLAGRNLDLGAPVNISGSVAAANADGIGLGITSIGNSRNPSLPFTGANVITAAGIGGPADLSNNPNLSFTTFDTQYLKSGNNGTNYLAELGVKTSDLSGLSAEQQAVLATDVFFLVLRDAGRAHTAGAATYDTGFAAISKLFGTSGNIGGVSLVSREIATTNGGDIQVLAPNGDVIVGFNVIGQALSQGIITQAGGNIDIFAKGDVTLGTSRVFTLRGGNIIIWSSAGSIAAGSASKTVTAAPPTRVLVDSASADVKTDLAGLATGGGIGVLATVAGVAPGNVDLIAPVGVVDAGDAGIRATGNLNIAATKVLNADNISVTGTSSGTPAVAAVSAPNIGGLTAGNQSQAATSGAADEQKRQQQQAAQPEEPDSSITVEVVGYGGGEGSSDASSTPAAQ
ncbi:MAG: filamentous hemagglutinin family protein [Chthoniobacter sp.]|nr:filamentous hemagglutinin family protein [Chthoniobacter sp.]